MALEKDDDDRKHARFSIASSMDSVSTAATEDTISDLKAAIAPPTAATRTSTGSIITKPPSNGSSSRPSLSSSSWQSARQAKKKSDEIDRFLRQEAAKAVKEVKVATFGSGSEYEALWRQICASALEKGEEEEEREGDGAWRGLNDASEEVDAAKEYLRRRILEVEVLRSAIRRTRELRRKGVFIDNEAVQKVNDEIANFKLTEENVDEYIEMVKHHVAEDDRDQICEAIPGYTRITERDWLFYRQARQMLRDLVVPLDGLCFRFLALRSTCSNLRKLGAVFDGSKVSIFIANLAGYDELSIEEEEEDPEMTRLADSKTLFSSIAGWSRTKDAVHVLVFTGEGKFRSKLGRSPLARHIPGYGGAGEGQDEASAALGFLEGWFRECVPDDRKLHVVVTDKLDAETLQSAMRAAAWSLSMSVNQPTV